MAQIPRQADKLFSKVAGIYFNIIMPGERLENKLSYKSQKIVKDFLLERVEKEGNNFALHLITYKREASEFPIPLEDTLRAVLPNEGVVVSSRTGFVVRKVGRREFIKKAFELEAILGRKLEYGVGDISNPKEYTADLLELAKVMRASDIHIHPNPVDRESGIIKFRIDGKLREIDNFSSNNLRSLLDHIHSLNLEKLTQDSKDTCVFEGGFYIGNDKKTKYRLSSMPITTGFAPKEGIGESAKNKSYSLAVRLLKTEDIDLSLFKLGYFPGDIEKVQNLIKERGGFILVTGITGMGKTTTIGSIVNMIAEQYKGEKKIITFEDPIEYHLKGALQFDVTTNENSSEQLTYKSALMHCLRQDPDVIVVGEVRDAETAIYMVKAAQTGHLIFATIHSKDPMGALDQLRGFGIQGPAINDSLLGIISQMLIRKNCPQCIEKGEAQHIGKGERNLTDKEVNYFFQPPSGNSEEYETLKKNISHLVVAEGTGEYQGGVCQKCEGLKYCGRLPLVQIYVHKTEYAPIISSICNDDPDGPARMKELFMKGVNQPFALNALHNLFYEYTSPEELIDNLPPSYFSDYSSLLIKEANRLIQQQMQEDKAKHTM